VKPRFPISPVVVSIKNVDPRESRRANARDSGSNFMITYNYRIIKIVFASML
jgi:hypothetical protein